MSFSDFIFTFAVSLDIDIDSEDYAVTDNCESQIKPDIQENTTSKIEETPEPIQTSQIQANDEVDLNRKPSPDNGAAREKDTKEFLKEKLHIDNGENGLLSFLDKAIFELFVRVTIAVPCF